MDNLPEMKGIAFTDLWGQTKDGQWYKINITERAPEGSAHALKGLMDTINAAEKLGLRVTKTGGVSQPADDPFTDPQPDQGDMFLDDGPQTPSQVPAQAGGIEVIPADKLLCEITDGKKYFKIKGGNYSKFGVRVWDEVLEAAGMDMSKVQAKEYDITSKNLDAVIEKWIDQRTKKERMKVGELVPRQAQVPDEEEVPF